MANIRIWPSSWTKLTLPIQQPLEELPEHDWPVITSQVNGVSLFGLGLRNGDDLTSKIVGIVTVCVLVRFLFAGGHLMVAGRGQFCQPIKIAIVSNDYGQIGPTQLFNLLTDTHLENISVPRRTDGSCRFILLLGYYVLVPSPPTLLISFSFAGTRDGVGGSVVHDCRQRRWSRCQGSESRGHPDDSEFGDVDWDHGGSEVRKSSVHFHHLVFVFRGFFPFFPPVQQTRDRIGNRVFCGV